MYPHDSCFRCCLFWKFAPQLSWASTLLRVPVKHLYQAHGITGGLSSACLLEGGRESSSTCTLWPPRYDGLLARGGGYFRLDSVCRIPFISRSMSLTLAQISYIPLEPKTAVLLSPFLYFSPPVCDLRVYLPTVPSPTNAHIP